MENSKEKPTARRWPSSVGPDDKLYAMVDSTTGEAKYVVFESSEKNDTFVRDNGSWFTVTEEFFDDVDDPDIYNVDVDVDFIDKFDEATMSGDRYPVLVELMQSKTEEEPVTAAADPDCPEATQDIAINLKNRKNAIDTAMYGPANPALENTEYWEKLAGEWGISTDEAKTQLCGNCTMFVITSKMKSCIEAGVTGGRDDDEWDSIDAAGELGYCEAFDFKCAAARTCRAWVAGGPISDNIQS